MGSPPPVKTFAELFPAFPNDPVLPHWRGLMRELDLRVGAQLGDIADFHNAFNQLEADLMARVTQELADALAQLTAAGGGIHTLTTGVGLVGGPITTGSGEVALATPVALANGGTGISAASVAAALAHLGGAPLASPNFSGTVSVNGVALGTMFLPVNNPSYTGVLNGPGGFRVETFAGNDTVTARGLNATAIHANAIVWQATPGISAILGTMNAASKSSGGTQTMPGVFTAYSSSYESIEQYLGRIDLFIDSGLTPNAVFTPTRRARLSMTPANPPWTSESTSLTVTAPDHALTVRVYDDEAMLYNAPSGEGWLGGGAIIFDWPPDQTYDPYGVLQPHLLDIRSHAIVRGALNVTSSVWASEVVAVGGMRVIGIGAAGLGSAGFTIAAQDGMPIGGLWRNGDHVFGITSGMYQYNGPETFPGSGVYPDWEMRAAHTSVEILQIEAGKLSFAAQSGLSPVGPDVPKGPGTGVSPPVRLLIDPTGYTGTELLFRIDNSGVYF
jgi:hypothetical protein